MYRKLPSKYTILVLLIILLCSGILVQFAILSPRRPSVNTHYTYQPNDKPHSIKKVHFSPPPSTLLTPPSPPNQVIPEACQGVDFKWLASDRKFWDGWSSKSMFIKPNGKFTRKTIRINQGESICITTLLGPIPALSIIKAMSHYGPADSIMVTALDSTGLSIPITFHQHPQQTNSYFASVQMNHAGTFQLDTSVEYRSYFWEYPNFHKYLPNRFLSENKLIVRPAPPALEPCNSVKPDLVSSAWKKTKGSVYQFLPRCQLLECNRFKTVHYWGDDHLKRNLWVALNLSPSTGFSNDCDPMQLKTVQFPIQHANQTIHFNSLTGDALVQSLGPYQAEVERKARKLPKPDLVVLGIGNHDLGAIRQDPAEFARHFYTFLDSFTKIYPDQPLIVKTTQPIAGKLYAGYNYGRSEAYAQIIRTSVEALNSSRVVVWDTHQLGFRGNQCSDQTISRKTVIQLENRLFSHLLCSL